MLYRRYSIADLIELSSLDLALGLLVPHAMLGLAGTLNICILLMVPGLSGGISQTVMIGNAANSRIDSAGNSIRTAYENLQAKPEPPNGSYL